MRGNAERTEHDSRRFISRFVDHWPRQPSSLLDLRAPRSLPSRFHFKLLNSTEVAGVYAQAVMIQRITCRNAVAEFLYVLTKELERLL